jgi:D-alanine-D-alanine ligase
VWRRDGEPLALTPGSGIEGVDVVFPVLHGPFGEDGTVQGLLECVDVPFVGAGVLASALCMDKVLFKDLMAQAAVPQVEYRGISQAHFRSYPAAVLQELAGLGLPVFVKPARLGSSVGLFASRAPTSCARHSRSRLSTTRWRSSRRPRPAWRSSAR